MKKLPLLLLSTMLLAGIVGCNDTPATSQPTSKVDPSTPVTSEKTSVESVISVDEPTSEITSEEASSDTTTSEASSTTTSEEPVVVEGVEITGADVTTVIEKTTLTLNARVISSTEGLTVTWSSSDEEVATVSKGVVTFKDVTENKEVTITATSTNDVEKHASVTFTVYDSAVDLSKSRGNVNSSTFTTDGTLSIDKPVDSALVFNGVHSTKFYVQADVEITGFNPNDTYPKMGIMTGTKEGYWNQDSKNLFYYADTASPSTNSSWTTFNLVNNTPNKNDWDWNNQKGHFVAKDAISKDQKYTIGMLRDGADYYLFALKDGALTSYKHVHYTDIAAEEATYAWVGGWNTSYKASNLLAVTGDAVDEYFETPTTLELSKTSYTMYIEDTYQIVPNLDKIAIRPGSVTYTSSNTDIATVDSRGLVTAKSVGECTITVQTGELSKVLNLTVTDDITYNVNIDGTMEDAIWSEEVKSNKYTLTRLEGNYIDFYATKTSKGVFIFADYHATEAKAIDNSWWNNDNFEFFLVTQNNYTVNNGNNVQRYFSTANGFTISGNITDGKMTTISNEENNYNFHIELFISHDDTNIPETEDIIFKVGYNGAKGWVQCPWWGSSTYSECLKITNKGLVYFVDESVHCSDGHTYTKWTTVSEPTCLQPGSKTSTCDFCGHAHEEAIPNTEAPHTWDETSEVTVVTPSDCYTHGKGTVECTTCHTTQEVELPYEHTFENGRCTTCQQIENPIVNTLKETSGGWDNRNNWSDIATDVEGEFVIKASYHFDGNLGVDAFQVWRHPLLVITDSNQKGTMVGESPLAYGDNATFRLDWYCWMDDRNGDGVKIADSIVNGEMFVNNFDHDMSKVIKGSYVDLTITRTGNDLTFNYEITTKDGGNKWTYNTARLNGLKTNKLDISLSAEFARFTITSVSVKHL